MTTDRKWVVCTWPGCKYNRPSVMRIGAMGCYTGHTYILLAEDDEIRQIQQKLASLAGPSDEGTPSQCRTVVRPWSKHVKAAAPYGAAATW